MDFKIIRVGTLGVIVTVVCVLLAQHDARSAKTTDSWWNVQSIDTMKYSRDLAREKLNDELFQETIDVQMKNISDLGATHVAIGTPYDEEFLPFLKIWVSAARAQGLSVWFRGNFSGWEGWFDYPEITKSEHLRLTEKFILNNKSLFENGDIFTSCPECENGSLGDPRQTKQVKAYREFLVEERDLAHRSFVAIGKDVKTNYYSMNGDVASLVMDKETTALLDGVVVVDHYVGSPEELVADIKKYAKSSGGRVVLGEMGAPVPDIHGAMSEREQAEWIDEALGLLSKEDVVLGLNYWVFSGGSTGVFTDQGEEKASAQVIAKYFKPQKLTLRISSSNGGPIPNATVMVGANEYISDRQGRVDIAVVPKINEILVSADGYKMYSQKLINPLNVQKVVLESERESILNRIISFFRKLFSN